MTIAARIVCVCFPSGDRAFARYVQLLLPAAAEDARRLQDRLRGVYQDAVVRPRELSGETRATWYVYRDGRALAASGGVDWWREPGVGFIRHSGGLVVEANDEVHEMLGYKPGTLVGQPSTIFLLPPVEADAELIRTIFLETGLIESTLPVRTAMGEPATLEHRTELQPDGSITSIVRRVSVVERRAPD
jgi:PAS domain-containing protein